VLVYNLEKITPFVREFGLAALVLVAGLIFLGIILWGFWILANDTRERHWKHMDRQADQLDRLATLDERQGEILSTVQNTQGMHGEKIAETHSLVRDIHGAVKQWGTPSGT
jgi:type VI protein secretion system component VasK